MSAQLWAIYIYVTGSGQIQHFAYLRFCYITIMSQFTSVLSMSIYNSTVSELQHFVMQPLILLILMAVNLHHNWGIGYTTY